MVAPPSECERPLHLSLSLACSVEALRAAAPQAWPWSNTALHWQDSPPAVGE